MAPFTAPAEAQALWQTPLGWVHERPSQQMEDRTRAQVLRRLNYVNGHIDGIKKMIEADRYCVDVLKQSYAVRKALEKVEQIILEGHLQTCVVEGIKQGDSSQVIDELLELYSQANR